MKYWIKDGVLYKLPELQDAVYDREKLAARILSAALALQNLKDRSADIDEMRFEKPGEFIVTSTFGRDEIQINPPIIPKQGKKEIEETRKRRSLSIEYVPAIEAYDSGLNFIGLLVSQLGTFDPPYDFYEVQTGILDEFLWGQWKIYYGSKPFTQREEAKVYQGGNTSLYVVPNTGEEFAVLEPYLGDTYSAWNNNAVQGMTENYVACCMNPDPICTDGESCDSVMVNYWLYTVAQGESWDSGMFIWTPEYEESGTLGPEVANSRGTEQNVYNGENTNALMPHAVLTFCPSPGPGSPCSYCEGVQEGLPPAGEPTSLPIFGDTYEHFWDITYSEIFQNWILLLWFFYGENTNYIDADHGGSIITMAEGPAIDHSVRTDGADGASECDIVNTTDGVWDTLGQTNISQDDSGLIWQEGILIDGTFSPGGKSGSGYYDLEAFALSIPSYANYWSSAVAGYPIFMGSSLRADESGWPYFFYGRGGLNVTEFTNISSISSESVHSIPGVDGVYGRGYFRLVKKVVQTEEKWTRTISEE